MDIVLNHCLNCISVLYSRSARNNTEGGGNNITLAISIMPPHIRENEQISSEGGRDGYTEVDGDVQEGVGDAAGSGCFLEELIDLFVS
jgi:hypothetical protein